MQKGSNKCLSWQLFEVWTELNNLHTCRFNCCTTPIADQKKYYISVCVINCLHSVSTDIIYENSNVWKAYCAVSMDFITVPVVNEWIFNANKTKKKQTHHSTTHHVNIFIYLYLYESLYLHAVWMFDVFECVWSTCTRLSRSFIRSIPISSSSSRCMFKFCLIKRIESLLSSM